MELSNTKDIAEIAAEIGVTPQTLKLYLCRAEFSHIKKYWGYVENLTSKDIYQLKELSKRRRYVKKKKEQK